MRARYLAATALALLPVAATAQTTTRYEYDAKGRLIAVTRPTGLTNYVFDAADNRASVVTSSADGSVADASFEVPDLGTSFAYTPSVPGVTFSGSSGVAANGSAWGFAAAPDGHQVAFIQSNGGSSGAITLAIGNLQVGSRYHIALRIAQRPGFGANPITVQAAGSTVGTVAPASADFTTVATDTFQATAATASVTFTGSTSSGDISSGLDAIQVVSDSAYVVNGSFEQTGVTSYAYDPVGAGASFSGTAGIAANGSAWGFSAAPDGQQVAYLQANNGAAGSFSVPVSGLEPGRQYAVQFQAAQRPGYAITPISVAAGSATLGSLTPVLTAFQTMTTGMFQATAATSTLTFSVPPSTTDGASAVDAIQLVKMPLAVVVPLSGLKVISVP